MLKHNNDDSAAAGLVALRAELTRIAVCGFVILAGCTALLSLLLGSTHSLIWLSAAALLFLLVYQQTSTRLLLNREHTSSPLYARLGSANRMTIVRGWLIAASGGFLLLPSALQQHTILVWVVAATYSAAAILDRIDGYIARKTRHPSLLGAELDTVFDALGLLVAPLLAVLLSKIDVSYLLVSIAYYLFIAAIHVRQRRQQPVYALAPSKLRRTLAGFQMAYVAVVLWPPFQAQITAVAGYGFMIPLLAGFAIDWCVVSGRINPYQGRIASFIQWTESSMYNFLLPALRILLLLSISLILSQAHWSAVSVVAAVLAAVLITSGCAGRAGAALLLMLLAWTAPLPVFSPVMLLTLFGSIAILLFGCGRWSAWRADDDWVNRQDGA